MKICRCGWLIVNIPRPSFHFRVGGVFDINSKKRVSLIRDILLIKYIFIMRTITINGPRKSTINSIINKTTFVASCAYYTSKKVAIVSGVIIKADYKSMKSNLKNL